MKLKRIFLFTELFLVSIYYFMVLFSIIIQPINLILGFFFVFILPGYNLLSILKPEYKFTEKLGYVTVLSLAIESAFMLISYLLLYNFMTYPESNTSGFIFDPFLLTTAIMSINLILIFIKRIKNHKIKQNNDIKEEKFFRNFKSIKRRIKPKNVIIIISLFLALTFLCISAIYSNVPDNNFLANYVDYRSNFTFFFRVPLIFYFFLIISILCLTYIIFSVKNSYITLTCISIFLYCLWILPYLQIGNYYSNDSYYLFNSYEVYLKYGILSHQGYHFVMYNFDSLRYSTSLFSAILLTNATSMGIDFVLWYLYPLFYIFLPFFFYSVLKKHSNEKKKIEILLIILVIFILFTPQFLKYGHTAATGVFGIIIFLILVVEFFNLMRENKLNVRNSFLIVLLYFFLSLTHTEEGIYFLLLIILYTIYYFFFKIKKFKINSSSPLSHSNNKLKEESLILIQITDRIIQENRLKRELIKILLLLCILTLIFYMTMEFFGYFNAYFLMAFGKISFLKFFYDLNISTRVKISFLLRGGATISIFVLMSIIIGFISLFIILYISFFKTYNFFFRVYNFALKIFKKIYHSITKLILNKIFQIMFFPLMFILIILIDVVILYTLEEIFIITIIALILSYSIMVLQLFFFIKGILFYQIENDKQNFYLLTIVASSIVMVIFIISGDFFLATYVLHTRFLVFFVFCNSIIIEDTYFKGYVKRRKIQLIFLIIMVLSLGVFYSLRTLAFG